jgi:hypothetical protein
MIGGQHGWKVKKGDGESQSLLGSISDDLSHQLTIIMSCLSNRGSLQLSDRG